MPAFTAVGGAEHSANVGAVKAQLTVNGVKNAIRANLAGLAVFVAGVDKLLADKAIYSENATVYKLLSAEDYKNALSEFASLNNSYNK